MLTLLLLINAILDVVIATHLKAQKVLIVTEPRDGAITQILHWRNSIKSSFSSSVRKYTYLNLLEASNIGLNITFSTNGVLLDKSIAFKLRHLRVRQPQVSLDGLSPKIVDFHRGVKRNA